MIRHGSGRAGIRARSANSDTGVTMVEILVVISIALLVAAITFSVTTASSRRNRALSCLTNLAAGVSATPLDHRDVLAVAERLRSTLLDVLNRIVAEAVEEP